MIYALPQITYEFVNNYRKSHILNEEIHRKRMEKLEEETRRNRMKNMKCSDCIYYNEHEYCERNNMRTYMENNICRYYVEVKNDSECN